MRLTRNKKFNIVTWSCCPKRLFCVIYGFMISICDLYPNLIRVSTGKVAHTHKQLAYWKKRSIRVWKIVAINVTTKQSSINYCDLQQKKQVKDIRYHYIPVAFWDKIIDFADEPEKNFFSFFFLKKQTLLITFLALYAHL